MTFLPHRVAAKTAPRGLGLREGAEGRMVVPESSAVLADFPTPTVEGEIHLQIVENSQVASFYVAVDFSGTLEWIMCAVSEEVTDNATGEAWDHRVKFFNSSVG